MEMKMTVNLDVLDKVQSLEFLGTHIELLEGTQLKQRLIKETGETVMGHLFDFALGASRIPYVDHQTCRGHLPQTVSRSRVGGLELQHHTIR